jgi:hypothetical protein
VTNNAPKRRKRKTKGIIYEGQYKIGKANNNGDLLI